MGKEKLMISSNDLKIQQEKKVREIEDILQEYLPKQKGRQS